MSLRPGREPRYSGRCAAAWERRPAGPSGGAAGEADRGGPARVPRRGPGIRSARPGVRRSCLRCRLPAARPQAGPVPGSLRAVAGRRQTGPGGVRRRHVTGYGRLPSASPVRDRRLPLRADSPRHLRTPPAAVAARRLPGAGVLARLGAAAARTQASHLPDGPLRPVGVPVIAVLPQPSRALDQARAARRGPVRGLLPGRLARRRAHRPAATARDAAAGGAIRASGPPG